MFPVEWVFMFEFVPPLLEFVLMFVVGTVVGVDIVEELFDIDVFVLRALELVFASPPHAIIPTAAMPERHTASTFLINIVLSSLFQSLNERP